MKHIISLLIFILLFSSCHKNYNDEVMYDMVGMDEEMVPITRQEPNAPPPPIDKIEKQEVVKKKIIKDGKIKLRVTELESTKHGVDTLMAKYNAYYANESFNNSNRESSYELKIRIPCANFEKFIAAIESGNGEILYKEIDARDVTDQFIDLETRLENKRNYLKRYSDLLKQAKSIKEILEIEEKIRGLEEEIESTTGRLKYLSDLVDYSTLNLTITKQKEYQYNPASRDKFSERLKHSLSKGWFGFVDLLLFLIKIWPFWIILTPILYFWRKYRKAKKKK
jgi:hypothetical protein